MKQNATEKDDMKRFPEFLLEYTRDEVPPSAADAMRNWLRIHAYIRKLPSTEASLRIVGAMLVYEYRRKPGPRMDIVVRLHGRLNALRFEVERVQLGKRN